MNTAIIKIVSRSCSSVLLRSERGSKAVDYRDNQEFLKLYQEYRYKHQFDFYTARQTEFAKAKMQAVILGVILMLLATIAGIIASYTALSWLKLTCLLIAAISPVLYTTLTAYSALYGFEQQAKLYRDTSYALLQTHTTSPDLRQGLTEEQYKKELDKYVHEVENIFLVEQGQWGQLAKKMKPSEL